MKIRFSRLAARTLIAALLATMVSACIENNIPYPRIQANFLTFAVEGSDGDAVIDSATRNIRIKFPETANLADVTVTSYTITPGASLVGEQLSKLNLETPQRVVLRLYQDYDWTISASQDIERHFTFEGQIGTATIDVPGKRVVAYVSDKFDITQIHVTSIKLGAEGSTMDPDLNDAKADFSAPVTVNVTTHGVTSRWTIYLQPSEASVTTSSADAWSRVAFVYGDAEAGHDNGVEYRVKGADEWTRVPAEWLTHNGGSFVARIIHLTPETTYEVRAYSDEEYGQAIEVTTDPERQVVGSDFDNWWLDGKVWNPWVQGETQYWDTGNKGATTLGGSNTVPTDDTATGSGKAAKLQTQFVGIGALGKLAAGNIFYGYYVRTDGTNGVLSFGREFNLRPTKVRGYYKYRTAPISHSNSTYEYLKGQPDTCIVWCALIDQDTPFEIRTNPKNLQLFNENGPYVVAYGKIEQGNNVNSYTPFEFELKYKSTSRVPKFLLITASASKYGDYFTGGDGAILWLDNIELEYDY
ncbi:MAG: PCMD domain-containing protein [Muribaculaceae bacterium]